MTPFFRFLGVSLLFIISAIMLTGLTGCGSSAEGIKKDYVWPSPPDTARIRYVMSLSNERSIEGGGGPSWLEQLAGEESSLSLRKPYSVAVDNTGRVFVTDTELSAILMFDFEKKTLERFGSVSAPSSITVDSSGLVYVSDGQRKAIFVFNREGEGVRLIGGQEYFENPTGIAVDQGRDRIYVVDTKAHDVKVFSLSGEFLFKFGSRGSGDGEFNFPTNITVGKDGKVYVVDTINNRVQIFDHEGMFLSTFGSLGDALGQFSRPKGIALDSHDNIYVIDAAFSNFQIFDQKFDLLMFLGSLGSQPGMFRLPADIHIDVNDRIYVADQLNRRVEVFQLITTSQ